MKRYLQLVASTAWFIEPVRAAQFIEVLETRLENGSRAGPFLSEDEREASDVRARVDMIPMGATNDGTIKQLARIPMIGTILPRGSAMSEMSGGGAVSMTRFMQEFQTAANDPNVGAILLEFDSPGGAVDLVPEAARMIRNARRAGRPIVAHANTMAASAAYWLASAADELVVTPSGSVGSIGVFAVHEDHSAEFEAHGINVTYIYEGARKVEGNPFQPLSDEARAALQADVRTFYEMFTSDVAEFRGVKASVVRADPEATQQSFGGGRSYGVGQLKALGLIGKGGMVDRVETLQATVDRLMGRKRNASTRKAKLALM